MVDGIRVTYTFSVVSTDECPINADTVFISTVLFSARVAKVCLAVWKCSGNGRLILSPSVWREMLMVLFFEFSVSFKFSRLLRSNSSSSRPNTKLSLRPTYVDIETGEPITDVN